MNEEARQAILVRFKETRDGLLAALLDFHSYSTEILRLQDDHPDLGYLHQEVEAAHARLQMENQEAAGFLQDAERGNQ